MTHDIDLLTELRALSKLIKTLYPCGKLYLEVCARIDKMTDSELYIIYHADIKWFSSFALNRMIHRQII